MAENEEVIFQINIDVGQSEDKVQSLSKSINNLTDEQKMLRSEIKKNGDETGLYSKKLEESRVKTSELKKERRAMIDVLKANAKSLDQVRAANKTLTKQRNALNVSTVQGKKDLIAINKKLDENNKFIKKNSDNLSKQKQGIGNYVGALKNSGVQMLESIGVLSALISAYSGLKSILNSTAEGQIFLAKVSGATGAVLNTLRDYIIDTYNELSNFNSKVEDTRTILQKLSDVFLDFYSVRGEGFMQFIGSASDILKGNFKDALLNVTDGFVQMTLGIEGATKKTVELTNKIKIMADFGAAIAVSEKKLALDRSVFARQEAADLAMISDLMVKAEQKDKFSAEERQVFLEKAISLQTKVGNSRVAFANQEAALQQATFNANKSNIDEEIALNEILAKADEEKRASTKKLIALESKLQSTKREASLIDSEWTVAVNTETQLLIAENAIMEAERAASKRIELQKEMADSAIKEAERAAKKQAEIDKATVKIKQALISASQKIITNLFNSSIDNEIAVIQDQSKIKQDILKKQLENGEITEKEYADGIDKIKKKQRRDEAKAEKKKALFDIVIATAVAVVKALPNPVTAILAAALGAIELAVVAAKPLPSLAKGGGIFGGNLHAQGGVQLSADGIPIAEVERDEGFFVMKRSATAELSELSALNERHGGSSFFDTPQSFLADGGEVQQQADTASIVQAIQDLNIFVTVTDIQEGLATQAKITELSTV